MSKGEKAGGLIGLAVIAIVIVAIGSVMLGSDDTKTSEPTAESSQQTVSADLPEDQQLKKNVENTLSGKNNMDKDYIRNIIVTEQADGGWGVFVDYNADDNLTTDARKKSVEMKMSEVYIALYTSGKDVRNASVAAYFPLTDSYGNESDGVIYKSVLEKTEADKVNFKANESTLKLNILPDVWETTVLNQEFR